MKNIFIMICTLILPDGTFVIEAKRNGPGREDFVFLGKGILIIKRL
jgi:hypothetical protein